MTDYRYFNSVLSKKDIIAIYQHKKQTDARCLLWNKNAEMELITTEERATILRDEIRKKLLRTERDKGGFLIKNFEKGEN